MNKKILYLLTTIITLFSFNMNARAAQELTCVYEKENLNEKLALVQNSKGEKIIYTNKKDAKSFDSSWEKQSNYKYDFKKVIDEIDSNNKDNLTTCPAYLELNGKKAKFYSWSTHSSNNQKLDKGFLTADLIENTSSANNLNATLKELTCVYKKGATTNKVILTQDGEGTQTLYTNEANEAIDGVGWIANKYSINVFYESLNEYGVLDSCPSYANAPTTEKKVDFFESITYDFDTWLPEGLEPNGEYDEAKEVGTTHATTPSSSEGSLIELNPNDSKYTAWCKYKKMLDSGKYHYIQLNYGKEHVLITEYDPEKVDSSNVNHSGKNEYQWNEIEMETSLLGYQQEVTVSHSYKFEVDTGFTYDYFLGLNNGKCPAGIRVKRQTPVERPGQNYKSMGIYTKVLADSKNGELYTIDDADGHNPLNENEEITVGSSLQPITFIKVEIENCADLVGEDIAGYLNIIWNIAKIGVPLILIGFGTIDFAQAIFAGKEDGMKKAQEKFIKRVIIAIVIFLVPSLLTLLLNIANGIWSNIGTDVCGIIF